MDEYGPRRILVVDDDGQLRAILVELLRWQGYRVNEAADGAEALSVAVVVRPDLIVTDLNMPVMDGPTFIRCCRRISGLGNVPIVVMSAQDEPGGLLQLVQLGDVSAILVKPFGVEELTHAIESEQAANDYWSGYVGLSVHR
jgi:CheY-like chemotaxis protein